jgi:ABC-type polysaccharide/polyol phosphate export permease
MPFGSKLLASRNLLKNLVMRDLKSRYVGSVGGFIWSIVHPLVRLASYSFVFTIVFNITPDDGNVGYPVFLFCGMLPWLLFEDTVSRSCTVIVDNASLVTKTIMPAEALPVAITISNLVHHAIGIGIALAIMGVFHSIHASTILILLYLPILVLSAQGLGWIAASLHVFLRDTSQALQIVMFLWFWFTPVLYPMSRLGPELQSLLTMNPLAVLVEGYRNALLGLPHPDPIRIAGSFLFAVAIFVVGGLIFRQAKPTFADAL